MTALSPAEIAAYRRDGYVIPDFHVGSARLAAMRAALGRLLDENPHLASDVIICPHLLDEGVQGLRGAGAWLEFACAPELLDLAESVLGPDMILWGTTVFGKPAGTGKATPWHQDAAYWPIRPLATCTVWVALDDSGPENGCLRVIPGTHRSRDRYEHKTEDRDDRTLNKEIAPAAFDAGQARDLVLKAGQVSLHDAYLVHGSAPNRSGRRRAGFVIRLMPATSLWDRELGRRMAGEQSLVDFAGRTLYLVRGTDRDGRNGALPPPLEAAENAPRRHHHPSTSSG
ncbi:MAG: phytanoyl-CoA dioxygenase family protein [Kiloniellales bacterium]|nr:phytanoyl-CoA dioxygenase family protein [Kiloniellales bacterium]